jgi:hypothetical protein
VLVEVELGGVVIPQVKLMTVEVEVPVGPMHLGVVEVEVLLTVALMVEMGAQEAQVP